MSMIILSLMTILGQIGPFSTPMKDEAENPVVDGELFQHVRAADCSWCLDEVKGAHRELVVSLEKEKQMRWLMLTRT